MRGNWDIGLVRIPPDDLHPCRDVIIFSGTGGVIMHGRKRKTVVDGWYLHRKLPSKGKSVRASCPYLSAGHSGSPRESLRCGMSDSSVRGSDEDQTIGNSVPVRCLDQVCNLLGGISLLQWFWFRFSPDGSQHFSCHGRPSCAGSGFCDAAVSISSRWTSLDDMQKRKPNEESGLIWKTNRQNLIRIIFQLVMNYNSPRADQISARFRWLCSFRIGFPTLRSLPGSRISRCILRPSQIADCQSAFGTLPDPFSHLSGNSALSPDWAATSFLRSLQLMSSFRSPDKAGGHKSGLYRSGSFGSGKCCYPAGHNRYRILVSCYRSFSLYSLTVSCPAIKFAFIIAHRHLW